VYIYLHMHFILATSSWDYPGFPARSSKHPRISAMVPRRRLHLIWNPPFPHAVTSYNIGWGTWCTLRRTSMNWGVMMLGKRRLSDKEELPELEVGARCDLLRLATSTWLIRGKSTTDFKLRFVTLDLEPQPSPFFSQSFPPLLSLPPM
jgi:hypothetical protein